MDMKQKTGLAIGAGVIGIGAALGVAWAVTGNNSAAQAQGTTQAQAPGEGRGPGGGGMGMQNMAKLLAAKLGVDESEVSAAIQSAMQADRPEGAPSAGAQPSQGARPSQGSGGGSMDATLAKAIATKLGIDEAKVTAALEEVRSEQQANGQGNDGGGANPQPSATA